MSDAPLHERLTALATQMYEKAWELDPASGLPPMRDFATAVSEFANVCEKEYVRLSDDDETPTVAQGVALARFLRSHFRRDDVSSRYANVARGGAGLSDTYLHVRFGDGFEGGIAPDGSVST